MNVTDPTVWVVNKSTLVTNDDARTMTAAVNRQMFAHVELVWDLPRTPVAFTKTPPRGGRVIALVDLADDPEALGYHTEIGAIQSGIVGCKPELDQGAHPLTGPYSVASILSHEVLEMVVDPRCNLWADSGQGFLCAYEVGDPVQSDHYDITVISTTIGAAPTTVTVSNFVFPAFFDPLTPAGTKLDHLGLVPAPFTLRPGGYWVQMVDGQPSQQFGDEMPAWLIDAKLGNPCSRTNRRTGTPVA